MDYGKIRNLPAMFFDRAAAEGDRPFLWAKRGDEWQAQSYAAVAEQVSALSRGLRALGVAPGDRVGIVAENRPEWLIADVAIAATGAIVVPAYTTNTAEDHLHVLNDSGTKATIVADPDLAARVLPAARRAAAPPLVIGMTVDAVAGADGLPVATWDEVLARGRAEPDDAARYANEIARDRTVCLIYTSGTGGAPKGVMLSHRAILANCRGAHELLEDLPGFGDGPEVFLSFLPLSHAYEHTAGLYFPISIGAQVYYAEGVDKLAANIAETRPTIVTAVPRLYESMHARIMHGVNRTTGLKRRLFDKALDLGRRRYDPADRLSPLDRLVDRAVDRLVRDKVRARFGGRLKAFVSGGAPLNPEIGSFFLALGLRILQGYGQTEAAPVISCNPVRRIRIETVGKPLAGVEVRIADDGEILARGDLLMEGYWNNPDATAEVLRDGWLHTGDIGIIDDDGYLRITDRKKDIIVNSGGDNLSPQRVEGMLTFEPEILQAMVYGDKRPHLVALLVPDPAFAEVWAAANGRPGGTGLDTLVADPAFEAALEAAVARVNAKLNVIERVRRFRLTAEPFTTENAMMTPSLKIRRHVIKERYGEALEGLYGR